MKTCRPSEGDWIVFRAPPTWWRLAEPVSGPPRFPVRAPDGTPPLAVDAVLIAPMHHSAECQRCAGAPNGSDECFFANREVELVTRDGRPNLPDRRRRQGDLAP